MGWFTKSSLAFLTGTVSGYGRKTTTRVTTWFLTGTRVHYCAVAAGSPFSSFREVTSLRIGQLWVREARRGMAQQGRTCASNTAGTYSGVFRDRKPSRRMYVRVRVKQLLPPRILRHEAHGLTSVRQIRKKNGFQIQRLIAQSCEDKISLRVSICDRDWFLLCVLLLYLPLWRVAIWPQLLFLVLLPRSLIRSSGTHRNPVESSDVTVPSAGLDTMQCGMLDPYLSDVGRINLMAARNSLRPLSDETG